MGAYINIGNAGFQSARNGEYVDKSMRVFAGVYMTGILPIKKYKTESALNNFQEYSMVEPRRLGRFFGFTKDEVYNLACVLSIAYYYARNDYVMHRELASGKGFADLVLIPRKNVDSPAIVVELKFSQDADAAIDQIKRRQYPAKVAQYAENLLLVGINYDKETKQHTCHIETWQG